MKANGNYSALNYIWSFFGGRGCFCFVCWEFFDFFGLFVCFFGGGRVEEVLDLVYDRKLTTLHIHKGISYFATCRIG